MAVHHELIALGLDLCLSDAVDGVVLEQMRERRGVGDVVDRDDFEVLLAQRRAINIRPIRPKPLIPILIATRNPPEVNLPRNESPIVNPPANFTLESIYHNFRRRVV